MSNPLTLKQVNQALDEKGFTDPIERQNRIDAIIKEHGPFRSDSDSIMGSIQPQVPQDTTSPTLTQTPIDTSQVTLTQALVPHAFEEQQRSGDAFTPTDTMTGLDPATQGMKDMFRQGGANIASMFSFLGRGGMALFEALKEKDRSTAADPRNVGIEGDFLKKLAKTKGDGVVGDIIRSPGLGGSLLAAPVAGPIVAGARGAPLLPRIFAGGKAGAVEGIGAVAGEQAEILGQTGKLDAEKGATTLILNTATGGLLPLVGQTSKYLITKGGDKILRSVVKPQGRLRETFKVEHLTKHNVAGNSLGDTLEKINTKLSKAESEMKGLVKNRKETFDLDEILNETAKEYNASIGQGRAFRGNEHVERDFKHWIDRINTLKLRYFESKGGKTLSSLGFGPVIPPDQKVEVPAEVLRQVIQEVADVVKFKAGHATQSPTVTQDVAKAFWIKLRNRLGELDPRIDKLNQEMADLIPLKEALEEAEHRVANNRMFGLNDIISLGAGGGFGAAVLRGDIPSILGTGALLAGTRAQKSPIVGKTLAKGGRALPESGTLTGQRISLPLRRFIADAAGVEDQ